MTSAPRFETLVVVTTTINRLAQEAADNGKPLNRFARDSQKTKSYRAENEVWEKNPAFQRPLLTAAEVTTLIRKVEGSKYVQKHFGVSNVQIEFISGRTSWAHGSWGVSIGQRYDWVVLHEMAHIYTSLDPGHNWLWRYVYVDLVRKFISEDAAKALKAAFKAAGLRITVPQKARTLTPEQRQAARERLAAARQARLGDSLGEDFVVVVPIVYYGSNKVKRWSVLSKADKYRSTDTHHYGNKAITRSTKAGITKILLLATLYESQHAVAVPASSVPQGYIPTDWVPVTRILRLTEKSA